MSDYTDNTQTVMEMANRAQTPIDRQIVVTHIGPGRYRVTRAVEPSPFTHSPGGDRCPH